MAYLRSLLARQLHTSAAAKGATTPRDSRFVRVLGTDIDAFRRITGENGVLTSSEDTEAYTIDWLHRYRAQGTPGSKRVVLRPSNTAQVSDILKYCNERKLAVVPQGGNTGLVGGSIPVWDEVVLSTQRISSVEHFDEVSGILTCGAGCVLESLDTYLEPKGFMMPLDLGAKGSCVIGGNVATNAGGLRLLRYGSLHGNVLGVQVVLANGDVLELGKGLRKDNTGYDLKQLFIGSEGTLGVITKVSILVPPRPQSQTVALLACTDFSQVLTLFKNAKQNLGEILSAFEFFDRPCLAMVVKHMGAVDPLPVLEGEDVPKFYVLIETSGSDADHDHEKVNSFLEKMMTGEGLPNNEPAVINGTMSQDESQYKSIWSLRETITESLSKEGGNYKYDVSVPVPQIYQVVESLRDHLVQKGIYTDVDTEVTADISNSHIAPHEKATGAVDKDQLPARVTHIVGFGHMGDGNLHLNATSTRYDEEIRVAIEDFLYDEIERRDGSISAEHGIGYMKKDHLDSGKSEQVIDTMKSIKTLFDPNGILNPYKMFPTTTTTH